MADEPAPPSAPGPAPPAVDVDELMKSDPAFFAKVVDRAGEIARHFVAHHAEQAANQATNAARSEFIQRCKVDAIKEHLGDMRELAPLLPDIDDPVVMRKAAAELQRKLQRTQPFAPSFRRPAEPNAVDLIQFGLELRKAQNRIPNRIDG